MCTPNANPMVAVTRARKGPQGQPAGSVATSPKEVDAICREEYGKIYKGNVSDHETLVKEYRGKYDTKESKFIYKAKRAKIDTITAEDLQTTARTTKETAGGLDQWAPADIKMLSTKAFQHLADMLNDIEG